VFDTVVTATLQNIHETDDVAVDIIMRLFKRVADACLGSKIGHLVKPVLGKQLFHALSVGQIQFEDPRGMAQIMGIEDSMSVSLALQPEAGMLVIFPSWLQHFVHPFHGKSRRVSIAFNTNIKSIKILPENG